VDLNTFLETAGQLSAAELASLLRVDQRQRWMAGERVLAECYFECHPYVATDVEAAVDVIFQEFLLRQHLGERPEIKEYADRFPAYAVMLENQIALQSALDDMDASLRASRAAAQTIVFPADESTPPAGTPRHAPIGMVVRDGMSSQLEVQSLLRRRLRVLSLTALFFGLAYLAIHLIDLVEGKLVFSSNWFEWAYGAFYLTVAGAVAGALWSSRPLAIGHLRVLELILFGACLLTYAVYIYIPVQSGALGNYAQLGEAGGWVLGSAVTLPAFAITVGYGLFIPNTWRRCAAVVAVMALLPLGVSALAMALGEQEINENLRFAYFREMGVWMAIGAIFAILGSHRIETLRQTASEARKLGPYRLIRRLGSGGMGQVYLAQHALLRRPCALKLIRPDQVGDREAQARFEREVQTMAALTHPNTVRVYDYGLATDGTFYYAMEYLPGLSLDQLVAEHGPLPAARVVYLLRQVCGALREAHEVGLVHRDIKPANIFACQIGGIHDTAKLLDFGLVRVHSLSVDAGLTAIGTIAGTPAFMSPEQAAGSADVDARSDIYSLGAVAYFLLTGQAPFVRATSVQTMAAHLTEPLVSPRLLCPEIPNDAEEVVLRCLAKEPHLRYAVMAAVEDALAGCACADSWSGEQSAIWWRDRPRASVAMA
jgi:serine/threonine-protein kinase